MQPNERRARPSCRKGEQSESSLEPVPQDVPDQPGDMNLPLVEVWEISDGESLVLS